MASHRLLMLLTAALLGACTVDKDLLTSTGELETGTTDAGGTGETEPTGGTGSTTSGSSGADPSDTTGAPDVPALCAAQIDEAGCAAVGVVETPDGSARCVWMSWTPVTLTGDVCTYGAPQGKCYHEFAGSEGCASFSACGQPGVGAAWKQDGDGVQLAYGRYCVAPPEGSDCDPEFPDEEVAPECACTCTPEFSP